MRAINQYQEFTREYAQKLTTGEKVKHFCKREFKAFGVKKCEVFFAKLSGISFATS